MYAGLYIIFMLFISDSYTIVGEIHVRKDFSKRLKTVSCRTIPERHDGKGRLVQNLFIIHPKTAMLLSNNFRSYGGLSALQEKDMSNPKKCVVRNNPRD